MPIIIKPAERTSVSRLVCPACGEKLRDVGLARDSRVDGLSFKCRRCGKLWGVESSFEKNTK